VSPYKYPYQILIWHPNPHHDRNPNPDFTLQELNGSLPEW